MYAKNNLTDNEWPEFKEKCDMIGLTGLAIHVTRMGQLCLGFPEENYQWCENADSEVCELLLNYIFQSGNFGRKQEAKSDLVNAMTRMRKNPFITLQKAGEHNWSLLKKYPALKPFAWVYQGFRYIHRGLKNKSGFKAVIESGQDSKNLRYVLDKMGID